MTALIAVSLLLAFLTFDGLVRHRIAPRIAGGARGAAPPRSGDETEFVGDYRVPRDLLYHRGHTWARPGAPGTAVVGVDAFAARLLGQVARIKLPMPGTRLEQGARAFRFRAGGCAPAAVSPGAGEVVEVNARVLRDPGLVARDPYGEGWLCRVQGRDLDASTSNLLPNRLARLFVEDAREQLETRLDVAGADSWRDGGDLAPDFATHLPREVRQDLLRHFLRTWCMTRRRAEVQACRDAAAAAAHARAKAARSLGKENDHASARTLGT